MPRSKPPHPREFREEAVRLVRSSGRPIAELGIAHGTLSAWVKQAELDAGLRSDGLTTAEREELRRLRRENRIPRYASWSRRGLIIGWPGCAGCWASPPAGTTRGGSVG
jgi:transposase